MPIAECRLEIEGHQGRGLKRTGELIVQQRERMSLSSGSTMFRHARQVSGIENHGPATQNQEPGAKDQVL